ncbi:MAG: helix-turn-helix domain-containing protein [Gammaproteobacteria bacterium]|nr:helix-turn-helix domain-containing protein [Gammaproteobacteria bacterium]MBL6999230.1 helix-turn-helix domain-containing protein [Gammaproteobacteria bacterium]
MALPKKFADMQDPTIHQAGEILQVSSSTIWRMCKKGLLKKYKTINGARIKLESIQALRDAAA